MSLRSFHIIFISITSVLMLYILFWSRSNDYSGYTSLSVFGFILLLVYNFSFSGYYNKIINNSTTHPFLSNFKLILLSSLSFVLPPIGFFLYYVQKNNRGTILKSLLIGIVCYLVALFGWISYGIEKESLGKFKEQFEVDNVK